jgi:hypothetical protein
MNDGYYESLTAKQTARWMALISAVDIIEGSCKKYKKNFDTIDIKPSALKKFIDVISVKYEHDMACAGDCAVKVDTGDKFFAKKPAKHLAYSSETL